MVKIQSNWDPHVLLVRMQQVSATLENILEICYKVKHTFIIQPCSLPPRCLPKWKENLQQQAEWLLPKMLGLDPRNL